MVSETLRWGGDFSAYPMGLLNIAGLLHSGIVAYVFWALMDKRVALVHIAVLYTVISTLWVTEGKLYCSIVC